MQPVAAAFQRQRDFVADASHELRTPLTLLRANAEMLEPVRASFRTNQPIEWVKVHNLPDFVYFNHSIHVAKGVGCETCHGRVDQMALTYKANTLFMEWCLDCHRHPENYVRPLDKVYTMGYQPEENQVALGRQLVADYNVQVKQLTNCSVCHR